MWVRLRTHTTGIDCGSKCFVTVHAKSACSEKAFCCNHLSCNAVYLKLETNYYLVALLIALRGQSTSSLNQITRFTHYGNGRSLSFPQGASDLIVATDAYNPVYCNLLLEWVGMLNFRSTLHNPVHLPPKLHCGDSTTAADAPQRPLPGNESGSRDP